MSWSNPLCRYIQIRHIPNRRHHCENCGHHRSDCHCEDCDVYEKQRDQEKKLSLIYDKFFKNRELTKENILYFLKESSLNATSVIPSDRESEVFNAGKMLGFGQAHGRPGNYNNYEEWVSQTQEKKINESMT